MATWLTNEDVQNYGHELVDFAQRAAAHALAPTLQQIEQSNAELQRRLAVEARHRLDQEIERAIPNYRELDRDPRWHDWLRGVDVLSGRVRQQLLNDAIASNSSHRVVAFFRGFFGGQPAAASQPSGQARGRSSSQRTYTRAQIAQLYEAHRKGAWAGREAEWARLEADFCRAGGEGRVLGPPYLPGK